jgi:MYXO-CTERM domain-containing protein
MMSLARAASSPLLAVRRSVPSRRRAARGVRWLFAAALAWGALAGPTEARAEPVWIGDLEGGDLSQWSGQLNGEHISVVMTPTIQGMYAAQVQLTNDAVWPNGLKRVELHHSPADARTAEGASTYFAWSFYLPETLPIDPGQQIGYWESDQSYQQVMAFDVEGEHIRFSTRKPNNQVHWEADGAVTAGAWHRIAMQITWSTDPGQGFVDVWFDGEQVVTQGSAQTLADDNPHFTQIGLLRGAIEFQDAPIIYIDDAVEGDTLEDVHPALPMGEGGGGGGGAGGQAGSGGGGGAGGAQNGSGGGGGAVSTAAGAGAAPPGGEESGGDCHLSPTRSGGPGAALAGLLAALAFVWRRRRSSVSG